MPAEIPTRAFMLDVSRDRVPTRATLSWLVDVLANCGFNEFQPYIEHTFEYAGFEAVWRDASPLTGADMGWLDGHCAARGISLVPNVNVFGHMDRWFAADESMRARAECPEGYPGLHSSEFGEYHKAPGCLAPTDDNANLGVDLVRDIASTVRGRRVHIGGDEPFELGLGVAKEATQTRGRDAVYIEHLNRLITPLADDGLEVLFWADMFRRDASAVEQIPPGAVGVVWHYSAPAAEPSEGLAAGNEAHLGVPDDGHLGFRSHARILAASGKPYWVAPGTSTWMSIIGRNGEAAANIDDAVSYAQERRAAGVLLTDWGDLGHWQPLAVSLPSIVRCGLRMQGEAMPDRDTVAAQVDDVAGFDRGTGGLIDDLGHISNTLGWGSIVGSPLWAPLTWLPFAITGKGDPSATCAAERTLDAAIERFSGGSVGGPHGEVVAAEMQAATTLARLALRRLDGIDIDADLGAAAEAHRTAWLRSSRPGGLEDSMQLFTSALD